MPHLYKFRSLAAAALAVSVAISGTAMAQVSPNPTIASGGNSGSGPGADMSPRASAAEVKTAADAITDKIPDGPFQPTWDSIEKNYKVPQWFNDAKFGIFMHWGLYTVPAYRGGGASEWYETHLYGNGATLNWHTQTFGSLDVFGYKDFIPLFTAAKWDPNAWALLFKKAGA